MDRDEIQRKVISTVALALELVEQELDSDTKLLPLVGGEESWLIDILMDIEDEMGMGLLDEGFTEVNTIGEAVDFIERRCAATGGE